MATIGFLDTRVARRLLRSVLLASVVPAVLVGIASIIVTRRAMERARAAEIQHATEAASLLVLGRLSSRSTIVANTGQASVSAATPLRLIVTPIEGGDAAIRLEGGDPFVTHSRELDAGFWAPIDDLLPEEGEASLCLFEAGTLHRIHCAAGVTAAEAARLARIAEDPARADAGTADLLNGTRDLFLRRGWSAADWRLVLSRAPAAPAREADQVVLTLLLLLGIAVSAAFTVAHRALRHSTAPLGVLRDVTRRMQEGELGARVTVQPGDEFADLGEAFNHLSVSLARQFDLLAALDYIDSAALVSRSDGTLLEATMAAVARVGGWEAACAGAMQEDGHLRVLRWHRDGARTWEDQGSCPVGAGDDPEGLRLLRHGGDVVGLMRLVPDGAWTDERRRAALLLGDRLALALGHVRLFARIGALSAGTLRAFANAIDANSSWTAGHSERVTHLALQLGRALGIEEVDLRRLYRGGLLHDIGKVAIPPAILDKPGRLDDEERRIIERHPAIGASILAPIGAFADLLPLVRSHHERPDGKGYPDRLSGTAVPWLARVLAVADVYDALTSHRPYRAGMPRAKALAIIEEGEGTQFDPAVVRALTGLDYLADDYDIAHDLRNEDAAIAPAQRRAIPAANEPTTGPHLAAVG